LVSPIETACHPYNSATLPCSTACGVSLSEYVCHYSLVTVLSCVVAVPGNFHDVLMHYTAQGHRVIGLAYKSLTSQTYVKVQRARRLGLPAV